MSDATLALIARIAEGTNCPYRAPGTHPEQKELHEDILLESFYPNKQNSMHFTKL